MKSHAISRSPEARLLAALVVLSLGFLPGCALYDALSDDAGSPQDAGQSDAGNTPDVEEVPDVDETPDVDEELDVDEAPNCHDNYELVPGIFPEEVVAGEKHSCARLSDGSVWCWGGNEHGQVAPGAPPGGRGALPARVELPCAEDGALPRAAQIAAGKAHTCAVLEDNLVICWGHNDSLQLGAEPDAAGFTTLDSTIFMERGVDDIAAGSGHTCVLVGGRVFCWGDNKEGQLGTGSSDEQVRFEGVEAARVKPNDLEDLIGVTSISSTAKHTCALDNRAQVWCWGKNDKGQIGNDSTEIQNVPHQPEWPQADLDDPVTQDPQEPIVLQAVAAGVEHSCAIDARGNVWCWGYNHREECRLEPGNHECQDASDIFATPFKTVDADELRRVAREGETGEEPEFELSAMSAGQKFTSVAASVVSEEIEGDFLVSFGINDRGQIGPKGADPGQKLFLVEGSFDSFSLGWEHACGVRLDDAQLLCWGDHKHRQLGATIPSDGGDDKCNTSGEATCSRTPVVVEFSE